VSGSARTLARIAAVALVASVVVARARVVGAPDPARPTSSDANGFAGARACALCHGEIHRAWAAGNHALSTVEARGVELPPDAHDGTVVHHPPGVSTFRARGDRFDVETTGPDGRPTRYPLEYVVGRRRLRMYVTRLTDGALQILPAMREEGTGAWFDYTHLVFGAPGLPPDEAPKIAPGEPSFWTGRVRSFDAGCTRCHVSGAQAVAPAADGTGPRSSWRALGVDCEACHGPAAAHVARWSDPPRGPAVDPIVRLRSLTPDAQLHACLVCHLEGDVVDPDFTPGEDVLEHVDPTLLDDPERIDPAGRPLELVYEGMGLLVSRCAQEGRLGCVACHASHGSSHGALLVRPATDDGLCSACHASLAADPRAHAHHRGDGPGARCVSCHMPKLTVERGHGAVTDHTIGVPDPIGIEGVRTARDACTGCHSAARGFPAGAPRLSAAAVRTAFTTWWPRARRRPAWSATIALGANGGALGLRRFEALAHDVTAPRLVRASAVSWLARTPGADPSTLLDLARDADSLLRRAAMTGLGSVQGDDADAALLDGLADASAAVRVHAARAALLGWERAARNRALLAAALPVLDRDAQAAPGDDRRWFRLGAARQIGGDLAGAVAAYERQCALDPFAAASRALIAKFKGRLAQPGGR